MCAQLSSLNKDHNIIVATDDERIYNAAQHIGVKVFMTNPEHRSGTDRCAELAATLDDANIIINVQGDEPFIQAEDVSKLIALLRSDAQLQIATLITKLSTPDKINDPNTVKVTVSKSNRALYFSRAPIPFGAAAQCYQHIGVYGFRKSVLLEIAQLEVSPLEQAERLEQLRWLENDYSIHTVETQSKYLSIDTPEDLKEAERRIAENNAKA